MCWCVQALSPYLFSVGIKHVVHCWDKRLNNYMKKQRVPVILCCFRIYVGVINWNVTRPRMILTEQTTYTHFCHIQLILRWSSMRRLITLHEINDPKATVMFELTLLLKYQQASMTEATKFHHCLSIS